MRESADGTPFMTASGNRIGKLKVLGVLLTLGVVAPAAIAFAHPEFFGTDLECGHRGRTKKARARARASPTGRMRAITPTREGYAYEARR